MRCAVLTRCIVVACTGRRDDCEAVVYVYLRSMLSSTVLNGVMKAIGVHSYWHYDSSVFACQQAEVNQSIGAGTRLAYISGKLARNRDRMPERLCWSMQVQLHTTSGTNTHHYKRSEQSYRDDDLRWCH